MKTFTLALIATLASFGKTVNLRKEKVNENGYQLAPGEELEFILSEQNADETHQHFLSTNSNGLAQTMSTQSFEPSELQKQTLYKPVFTQNSEEGIMSYDQYAQLMENYKIEPEDRGCVITPMSFDDTTYGCDSYGNTCRKTCESWGLKRTFAVGQKTNKDGLTFHEFQQVVDNLNSKSELGTEEDKDYVWRELTEDIIEANKVRRITYNHIEIFMNEGDGNGSYTFSDSLESGRTFEKEVTRSTQTLISASGKWEYEGITLESSASYTIDFSDVQKSMTHTTKSIAETITVSLAVPNAIYTKSVDIEYWNGSRQKISGGTLVRYEEPVTVKRVVEFDHDQNVTSDKLVDVN